MHMYIYWVALYYLAKIIALSTPYISKASQLVLKVINLQSDC